MLKVQVQTAMGGVSSSSAGCVTIDFGDMVMSVSPEGIEITDPNDDEVGPIELEKDEFSPY